MILGHKRPIDNEAKFWDVIGDMILVISALITILGILIFVNHLLQ